jgi:hypothetical protein
MKNTHLLTRKKTTPGFDQARILPALRSTIFTVSNAESR